MNRGGADVVRNLDQGSAQVSTAQLHKQVITYSKNLVTNELPCIGLN